MRIIWFGLVCWCINDSLPEVRVLFFPLFYPLIVDVYVIVQWIMCFEILKCLGDLLWSDIVMQISMFVV